MIYSSKRKQVKIVACLLLLILCLCRNAEAAARARAATEEAAAITSSSTRTATQNRKPIVVQPQEGVFLSCNQVEKASIRNSSSSQVCESIDLSTDLAVYRICSKECSESNHQPNVQTARIRRRQLQSEIILFDAGDMVNAGQNAIINKKN